MRHWSRGTASFRNTDWRIIKAIPRRITSPRWNAPVPVLCIASALSRCAGQPAPLPPTGAGPVTLFRNKANCSHVSESGTTPESGGDSGDLSANGRAAQPPARDRRIVLRFIRFGDGSIPGDFPLDGELGSELLSGRF